MVPPAPPWAGGEPPAISLVGAEQGSSLLSHRPASPTAHTRTTADLAEVTGQDWRPSAEALALATSQVVLGLQGTSPGAS